MYEVVFTLNNLVINIATVFASYSDTSGSSSSESSPFWILLIPLIIAAIFYSRTYRKYRNQNQNYQFESTTKVEIGNVVPFDILDSKVAGVTNNRIDGANEEYCRNRIKERTTTRLDSEVI